MARLACILAALLILAGCGYPSSKHPADPESRPILAPVEKHQPTPIYMQEQPDAPIVVQPLSTPEPPPPTTYMEVTTGGLATALSQKRLKCTARGITEKYDVAIRRAVKRYWSIERRVHWCWMKSVMWTESDFREDAVSSAGAAGLLQFVPGTWGEWSERIGMPQAEATDSKAAIRAGAAYMEYLMDFWIWARPQESTLVLATACYNAGCGNIHQAQKVADMSRHWYRSIRDGLPIVTGRHSEETWNYIDRIVNRYERLTGTTWVRY